MDGQQASQITVPAPVRSGGRARDWQHWTPYAAALWSLVYGALGIYWAVGGRGFPYTQTSSADGMGPLLGQFGSGVVWIVVILAGIPAAAMGVAMLRGVQGKLLRSLFITAGMLLALVLLLLMTSLGLLVLVGYIPYTIVGLFTGSKITEGLLQNWAQWATIHQLLCFAGGFFWLAATVSYARLSGNACLYCGRRDGPEGWTSPGKARRWGRNAVYVAMLAPIFYAFTRYAWALGIPLGMSNAELRHYQESGMWISGVFLATFAFVGALLMLGLVQRWGEVFPRWMDGLAGRRVPIALAVIPAAIGSVLLIVGGIGIWVALPQMSDNLAASGVTGIGFFWGIFFQLGGTLLFPVWGAALAVAALGYYYRRRGPCEVCGRGAPDTASESVTSQSSSAPLLSG
jgi:hypothetical protein